MHPAHHSRIRRIGTLVALAVVSVTALVVFIQCKPVSDGVTGVKQTQQSAGNCVADCAHQANALMQAESDLHVANVHACAGDPACLANEEARHVAAVEQIQSGKQQCMDNCKHQGGGNAR